MDDSGFWAPTHFLSEDEKHGNVDGDAGLCFPTEFPYEVDSPVSSNETDTSDDDDFLAGLSRRLARTTFHDSQRLEKPEKKVFSGGSPQSTLTGIGSWSGRSDGSPIGASEVSSPPATPFGFSNDTWELIYAAAGEVARLKMGGDVSSLGHHKSGLVGHNNGFYTHQAMGHNRSVSMENQVPSKFSPNFSAPKQDSLSAVWGGQVKPNWPAQFQNQQHHLNTQNRIRNTNVVCGPCLDHRRQASWSQQLQNQNQNQNIQIQRNGHVSGSRPVVLCGPVAKRESTGTGVFLPRRYSNPSENRKKQGCTPVLVPAKVVQALNLSFTDMNGHAQIRTGGGVAPDHEALIARRNALLLHQRRIMRPTQVPPQGHFCHEANLPQEWTY